MSTIADIVNKYLPMFDQNDSEYRILISDKDGVPAVLINKPSDYNIGSVANVLEWNRNLSKGLLKQVRIDQAWGKILDWYIETMIGLYREAGETDADFSWRAVHYVLAHRTSPASIINIVKDYSSQMPEILEGQTDAMFADYSFSDNYKSAFLITSGKFQNKWVFPAIADGSDYGQFFFTLIMYDLQLTDIDRVVSLVNQWKVAGVGYQILINHTA